MPIIKPKIVNYLRAYAFHGVDAEVDSNSDQAIATCVFCGKERKMYIRVDTGQFQCKTCLAGNEHGGGNIYTFLRLLWEQSEAATKDYSSLVASRKLLGDHTLINWGACLSTTTGDWIVPGYGADGKLNQLYRYIKDISTGRMKLLPTPELHHQLHGVNLYDEKREKVYVTEGCWDGMALWETLRLAKQGDDGLSLTASEELSLLHKANVLATPGCNVFSPAWCQLFAGKIVYLMFDSDHSRDFKGKRIDGAGYIGMKRVAQILARYEEPPKEIHFLKWGEEGFDPALPSGTDIRDILTTSLNGKPITLSDRVGKLQTLLSKVVPIPPDWVVGRSLDAEKNGNTELECVPCNNWKTLHTSWRAAMNWTEGLDRALSVMLACITSTRSIGDQLWVKVMGPAACWGFNSEIYDPVDGSSIGIGERCKMGIPFWVYTQNEDGSVGITQALPPKRFPKEPMYKVTFESGREIRVTGGHQIWNGASYVALMHIGNSFLPTFSVEALRGTPCVQSGSQTVSNCQDHCLRGRHHRDGLLPRPIMDALFSAPLHDDVRELNYDILSAAPSYAYGQQLCPHCSISSLYHVSLLPFGYESLPQLSSDGFEFECCSSALPQHTQLETIPQRISQLGSVHLPQSKNTVVQLQPLLEHPLPLYSLLETALYTRSECAQLDSMQLYQLSSFQKSGVSSYGEILFQPGPEHAELGLAQYGESSVSLQTSVQQDTAHRLSLDDVEEQQQPFYAPIRISKVRGDQLSSTVTNWDKIVKIEYVGDEEYYDFHVPITNNYYAVGYFHHNCGKSTLCEAVGVSRKHILAKSTIRGFHSGFKSDKEGVEDHSLASRLYDKTLVTKDGDAMLNAPNVSQILSEARDLYDGTGRSDYRNGVSREYQGLRMTWILCGTSSIRSLDSSELGERFLDCVIMEGIDDELEDEIMLRVANRTERGMAIVADSDVNNHYDPDLVEAMKLTGGYVEYLRANAQKLLGAVICPDDKMRQCIHLGKFVAYTRARPSTKQDENAEREFGTRLVSQLIRLAKCLAVVLNRKFIDDEVMRRVKKVALDTARGVTLELIHHLFKYGEEGVMSKALAAFTNQTEEKTRGLLRFLARIGVAEYTSNRITTGYVRSSWRITARMQRLYASVYHDELLLLKEEEANQNKEPELEPDYSPTDEE